MALRVGKIYAVLSASTEGFVKSMRSAAEEVEHTAKRIKRASREIATVGVEISAVMGEAIHAASKHNPEAKRALESLKSAWEAIASEIGMAALPVLREVARVVREVATWVRGLDPHLKTMIVRWAAIVAGVTLAIGALGELAGVVSGLAGFFRMAMGVMALFSAPVLAVIAGIAALIVVMAVFRKAWKEDLGGIREAVAPILDAIIGQFATLLSVVTDVGSAIKTGLTAAFDFAISAISEQINGLLTLLDLVLTGVEKVSGALHRKVDFSTAHQLIGAGHIAASPAVLKAAAQNAPAAAGTAIKTGAGFVVDALKDVGSEIKKAIASFLPNSKEGNALSRGEDSKVTDVKTPVQAAYALLSGTVQATNSLGEAIHLSTSDMFSLVHVIAEARREADRQRSIRHANRLTTDAGGAGAVSGARGEYNMDAVTAVLKPAIDWLANWLSNDWARDTAARLKSGTLDFVSTVTLALQSVGQQLSNALINAGGLFGETVKSAMQGFQSGGVWGALVAVIATLLEHSKVFQYIMNILNTVLQRVADILGSLLAGFEPLMGALDDVDRVVESLLAPILKQVGQLLGAIAPVLVVIAVVLQVLAPIFKFLSFVIGILADILKIVAEGLFFIVKGVGLAIIWVLKELADLWNGIVSAIQTVFDALAAIQINLGAKTITPFGFLIGWSDALNSAIISTDGLDKAQAQLKGLTYDQAAAMAANTAAQDANSQALDLATNSLMNVPEGFKVALAAFNSIVPGQGKQMYTGQTPGYDNQGNPNSPGLPHFAAGGIVSSPTVALVGEAGPEAIVPLSDGGVGGVTINAQIFSNDAKAIWGQLQDMIRRSRFTRFGTGSRPAF